MSKFKDDAREALHRISASYSPHDPKAAVRDLHERYYGTGAQRYTSEAASEETGRLAREMLHDAQIEVTRIAQRAGVEGAAAWKEFIRQVKGQI